MRRKDGGVRHHYYASEDVDRAITMLSLKWACSRTAAYERVVRDRSKQEQIGEGER